MTCARGKFSPNYAQKPCPNLTKISFRKHLFHGVAYFCRMRNPNFLWPRLFACHCWVILLCASDVKLLQTMWNGTIWILLQKIFASIFAKIYSRQRFQKSELGTEGFFKRTSSINISVACCVKGDFKLNLHWTVFIELCWQAKPLLATEYLVFLALSVGQAKLNFGWTVTPIPQARYWTFYCFL